MEKTGNETLEELVKLDAKLRKECMECYGGETYFDYGTAGFRKVGTAIKFVNPTI